MLAYHSFNLKLYFTTLYALKYTVSDGKEDGCQWSHQITPLHIHSFMKIQEHHNNIYHKYYPQLKVYRPLNIKDNIQLQASAYDRVSDVDRDFSGFLSSGAQIT